MKEELREIVKDLIERKGVAHTSSITEKAKKEGIIRDNLRRSRRGVHIKYSRNTGSDVKEALRQIALEEKYFSARVIKGVSYFPNRQAFEKYKEEH